MASKGTGNLSAKIGFFQKTWLEIKLVLRLMKDRRVNPLAKLLPGAAIIYWIVPDLVPGPIDDALVLWFVFYLFIDLCPPEVVEEHRQELLLVIPGKWRDARPEDGDPQVVDGEFHEIIG